MEFAGARLPPGMIHELENATLPKHDNVRTVQLEGSSAKADAYISGKPLWRQNEPDEDHWLAQQIAADLAAWVHKRSEEHTSELQSLIRISYAVFCLKKQKPSTNRKHYNP